MGRRRKKNNKLNVRKKKRKVSFLKKKGLYEKKYECSFRKTLLYNTGLMDARDYKSFEEFFNFKRLRGINNYRSSPEW